MTRAYHLTNSAEHGTRGDIVDSARIVLGGDIDCDPASTEAINAVHVRARKIYTADNSGLDAANLWKGTVFLNPPGGCQVVPVGRRKTLRYRRTVCDNESQPAFLDSDGKYNPKIPPCSCNLVKKFWCRLIEQYLVGHTTDAIWIGFSIEQFQSLQNTDSTFCPLDFPRCIPDRRLSYLDPSKDMEAQGSPPHASYIAYVGSNPRLFCAVFAQYGCVVYGR